VVNKVPVILFKLQHYTVSVVVLIGRLQNLVDGMAPVLDKLAIVEVDDVWQVEDLFVVHFFRTENLFSLLEVLIEELESPLIVEVNLINYFC
jgi:hypothetical protein